MVNLADITECRAALDEAIEADAEAWHQRATSRAAALNADMAVCVERDQRASRAEKCLSVAIERLDAALMRVEAAVCASGSAPTERVVPVAPGLVGEAVVGDGVGTAAVTPGRPADGDPRWLDELMADGRVEVGTAPRSRGRDRKQVELRRDGVVVARGALWRVPPEDAVEESE